jgi:hypothetical protein
MGCSSSKDLGTVEEPQQLNKEQIAKKELTEAEAAQKIADKEQAEFEASKKIASKEVAEHEQAVANMNKEQEEAEAARIAALEASGNLDALVEAAQKARIEADNASTFTKAIKQKQADDLDNAVIDARKKKEEADAVAEKERLEAEEAVRIEKKERLEAEEALRNLEKERLEAEEAVANAEKQRLEAEEAAKQTDEAQRVAQIKADKDAAAQKKRDEAPFYHKGNLMKKGDDLVGSWKTRFFIANNSKDNFSVDYFESAGGKKKGSIDCSGFKAVAFSADEVASNGPHGIKIVPKGAGRTWWLKAESAGSQKEWMHVISRACDNAGISGSQVVVEEKKE